MSFKYCEPSEVGDYCDNTECQTCCPHDEFDHCICIDCGYEREDGPIYDINED